MGSNVVAVILCLLSVASITHALTYGWGKNDQGQLGLGHSNSVYLPTSIPYYSDMPLIDVLTATNYHIALAANGSAFGSGLQFYGQFAVGYTSNVAIKSPIPCPSLNSSLDICIPGQFCNANMNTNLLGWGDKAGYVQNKNVGSFPKVQVALPSYRFDGKVVNIYSVQEGIFVRLANNTLWAAGSNLNGRLGNGDTSTTTFYSFVEVPFWRTVPLLKIFSSQSSHACAVATNNSLYCWGGNAYGQLGLGDTTPRYSPVRVRFFDDNALEIYKVSYGDSFTMVLTCGGKLFAFGANNFGQLGQVIPDSRAHGTPVEVTIANGGINSSIVDVVTGYSQTMIRTEDGIWYVWGGGTTGALGNGIGRDVYSPTPNNVLTNLHVNKVKSSSQSFNFFGWNDPSVTNERLGCPILENECIAGKHNCSENAYCTDLERGYYCTCFVGWIGDGYTTGTGCINMNSCAAQGHLCVPEAPCDDSSGYAICMCPLGSTGDGRIDSVGCVDIDECEGNPCASNAYCTNLSPNYNCTCNPNFIGDPDIAGCTILCQAGQYATNLTNCEFCPPGTYTDTTGAPNCFPCPAGTYNNEWGADELSDCKKCPTGGYSEPKATYCSLCIHGYTNDPGMTHTDDSTCTPCPLGTYGYYGECYSCEKGKFSVDAVAKRCRNCPPGHFINSEASLSCEACPAGTSSRGGTTSCASCPAGTYSKAGSKDCTKCPPGTSTNGLTGQSSCANCTEGLYNAKQGAPTCSSCLAGTFSDKPGSVTCQRCPQGTFNTAANATSCTSCSSGSVAPGTGSTKCTPCDSFSASLDGITCAPCKAGNYLDASTRTCKPCAPGTFVAVSGVAACYACSPGTYASGYGSTYCKRCDVNTYSNATTGYINCAACPAGKTSPGGAYTCS
jgi:alpha-tubulin suppressor-like RCC1 family protein